MEITLAIGQSMRFSNGMNAKVKALDDGKVTLLVTKESILSGEDVLVSRSLDSMIAAGYAS